MNPDQKLVATIGLALVLLAVFTSYLPYLKSVFLDSPTTPNPKLFVGPTLKTQDAVPGKPQYGQAVVPPDPGLGKNYVQAYA